MPPRLVVVVIVLGWLASFAWLAQEKWLPWLRPSEQPVFVVDLADEIAPQYASWTILRKEKKIGSAETRMIPRKDGTFEMRSTLRELELSSGFVSTKMPTFTTTRLVTREGEMLSLQANAQLNMKGFGSQFKIDAHLQGEVKGDEFIGECTFDGVKYPLEPIKLASKNAFSPFQPLQKYPPLRPGQSWRVANIDPVSETLSAAIKQMIAKMLADNSANPKKKEAAFGLPTTASPPKEMLAQVLDETEVIEYRGKSYTCWVIAYKADDVKARTWVDITDGKVIRQEATGMGDKLILQRE